MSKTLKQSIMTTELENTLSSLRSPLSSRPSSKQRKRLIAALTLAVRKLNTPTIPPTALYTP